VDPLLINGIDPVLLRGLEKGGEERDSVPRHKRARVPAKTVEEEAEPGFDPPKHALDDLA
jgi:hypothetical protein